MEFGNFVEELILEVSVVVASPGSAGIAAGIIFAALIVSVLWFWRQSIGRRKAITRLHKAVTAAANRAEFATNFTDFETAVSKDALKREKEFDWYVKRAWEEYSETLVVPEDEKNEEPVRNTVRPNFFFNSYDLGFDHGVWRHLPSIFVSVGLFLTFLGIIAALKNLIGEGPVSFSNENMRDFLDAAKSKFIMSLSGLLSSILFNLFYRYQTFRVEHSLSRLCDDIEFRVLFHTPEQIAAEQLIAIKEQTSQLQVLGNDLGAQIGDSISESLTRDLGPVLEKVSNSAGAEVGGLVGQIGDALNAKLNDSLDEVSKTLSTINRTLEDVTGRLAKSGDSIGAEMTKGIEGLNAVIEDTRRKLQADQNIARQSREADIETSQTAISTILESIENNTRENSARMNEAASDIASAAADLSDAITGASNEVSEKAGQAVENIGEEANQKVAETGAEITRKLAGVSGEFLENLGNFHRDIDGTLAEPIRKMVLSLEASNRELDRHAQALNQAAGAHEKAADSVIDSTRSLEAVAGPIASSVERAERINSAIRISLEHSLAMMEATRTAANQSMSAMNLAVDQLKETVSRADDIDEKLGTAFAHISSGLAESQDQIRSFSEEVTGRFSEGIQSIQTVLDGISEFEPARQRD